jgi:hypothetical protein
VAWAVVLLLVGLVIGSFAEIHAQSAGYRQMTDQAYGEMASRVIDASNQTGSQLATLIEDAPTIPNAPWPTTNGQGASLPSQSASVAGHSARALIQQGLDAAVAAADQESVQGAQLAPPGPAGDVAARLAAVLADRATAVTDLRTTIDRQLGMAPLGVAGAPAPSGQSTAAADGVASITPAQAGQQAAAEGGAFERSDRSYARLAAQLRGGKLTGAGPIGLPASEWARPGSPLASAQLAGTPALLDGSVALVPYHQLIISAVGLVPPAVPSATPDDLPGSGIVGTWCSQSPTPPTSATPGTTPTVLPPTTTVAALITVTNCGTVTEVGTPVTETLKLSDPPGTAAPPAGATGGTFQTALTVTAGSSQALTLGNLTVADGHSYTLTVDLQVPGGPAGQHNLAATTQEFWLQIAP